MKFFTLTSFVLSFFLLIDLFLFQTKQENKPAQVVQEASLLSKVVTLEDIFNPNHNPGDSLPKNEVITLLATGDVMLGRSVNIKTKATGDFNYPYQHTKDELAMADISLINLEGPLVENCPIINSGFTFCGGTKHIEGLVNAGIDVVNTANNHILNFGNTGFETTNKLVKGHNLILSNQYGANYLKVKGATFAFLGYNDLDYPTNADLEKEKQVIKTHIEQAKSQSDVVVVSTHWGNEYQNQPSARQRDLAHFIIDSGGDLVIGTHPHWIQPIEVYKDKIVAYSHGNFIFDQTWSEKTKEGVVGKYTFFQNKIIDVDFLPIYIEQIGQPKFILGGDRGKKILDEMRKESIFFTL